MSENNKYWKIAIEKMGIKDAMALNDEFRQNFKDLFPNIKAREYEKGSPVSWMSEFEPVSRFAFETPEEVNLANAIYLLMKDENGKVDNNKFQNLFQIVLRLTGSNSDWAF